LEKLPEIEITYPIAKTGIKAVINKIGGPAVALRVEFDDFLLKRKLVCPTLPRIKTEYNGLETYVAHACGHDANSRLSYVPQTFLPAPSRNKGKSCIHLPTSRRRSSL